MWTDNFGDHILEIDGFLTLTVVILSNIRRLRWRSSLPETFHSNAVKVDRLSTDWQPCALDRGYFVRFLILCMVKAEQALRPALNLIFYHFDCAERILKFQTHFILAVTAVCN